MYKQDTITELLKQAISETAEYCYKNKNQTNLTKLASGDLYTRLRRRIISNFTNCDISIDNIDSVYTSEEGEILYIDFLHIRFENESQKELVNMLKIAMEQINPNYDILLINSKMNVIFNTVEKFIV